MRRAPDLRSENRLQLALDEIARLRAAQVRISDGSSLVVITPTDPGEGTPTLPGPGVEALAHVLYGSKHSNSLRITDDGGLTIAFETSQAWVNGVFYTVAAGTLAMTDATTNYVFLASNGTVMANITGFPLDGSPLAIVVTAGGDITSIADRRSYLNTGAWQSMSGLLTTRGDILTRDATQLVRLGIGALGSILRADGTDPAWTINPTIAGYVRIGSAAAPTNVTAGDLTFVRAFVGDATNFSLSVVAGAPRITFDTNDYWEYNQATDSLGLTIGSVPKMSYIGGLTDEFRYDAVARFRAPSGISGTAVIDTRDSGAGSVARIDLIGYDSITGIDWYRRSDAAPADTRIKNAFELESGVNQDPDLVMYRFTGIGGAEVKDELWRCINVTGALRINAAKHLEFRDDAIYIASLDDAYLDLVADAGVRVTAPIGFSVSHSASVADALTIGPSDYGALAHLVLQPISGTNRVGFTTGTGYASILVGVAAATEVLRLTHADGGVFALGYARIGSGSTPTNVTAGDLTVDRLFVPDAALDAEARLVQILDTYTPGAGDFNTFYTVTSVDPGVGLGGDEQRAGKFEINVRPTAAYLGTVTGLYLEADHDSGAFNVASMQGLLAQVIQRVAGTTVTNARGLRLVASAAAGTITNAVPLWLDLGLSGDVGTITTGIGMDIRTAGAWAGTNVWGIRFFAAFGTPTITTLRGIQIADPPSGTITNLIGIDISALTRGSTLNFGIRNASNMVQTGYMRIGAITAPNNVTDGDFTCTRLNVGNVAFPAGFEAYIGGDLNITGQLDLDGDLNHDGANIGFFGTAPAPLAAAYTPTNVIADRAYNADATSVEELADVLGTLISDLQSYGLLQ